LARASPTRLSAWVDPFQPSAWANLARPLAKSSQLDLRFGLAWFNLRYGLGRLTFSLARPHSTFYVGWYDFRPNLISLTFNSIISIISLGRADQSRPSTQAVLTFAWTCLSWSLARPISSFGLGRTDTRFDLARLNSKFGLGQLDLRGMPTRLNLRARPTRLDLQTKSTQFDFWLGPTLPDLLPRLARPWARASPLDLRLGWLVSMFSSIWAISAFRPTQFNLWHNSTFDQASVDLTFWTYGIFWLS